MFHNQSRIWFTPINPRSYTEGRTMPIEMRRAYLSEIRLRYRNSTKKQKTLILNEFCEICGYSRKYAIRILKGEVTPRSKKPGPKPRYSEAIEALKELWLLMGQMCSKKMKAALPLWLPFYRTTKRIEGLLLAMSPSTIDRLLRPVRTPLSKKGLGTTRPNAALKGKIPIKLLDGDVTIPGYIESDTVAHCGGSISGEYAHSLTMTDLFSGWTENRAVWTKQADDIVKKVKAVEERLPFTLIGFASDNGTEFINEMLHAYLTKREAPVNFVRRRAYKKNDNAHVEQKNWTHVRQLFGYERFEERDLVAMMNEIYQAFWNPLLNLFTPVMKLKSKERIGGRIKKTYDEPKTPYQRLMESPFVPLAEKAKLSDIYRTKNPVYLRQQLDIKLKEFFQKVDEYKIQRRNTGS